MAHKSTAARALAGNVALSMVATALGAPYAADAAPVPMVDGGVVMPPRGWLSYCSRHDDDVACHAASTESTRPAQRNLPMLPTFTGFRSAVIWRVAGLSSACSDWSAGEPIDGECATSVPVSFPGLVDFSRREPPDLSDAPAPDLGAAQSKAASCAMDDHSTCSAEDLTAAHARDLKRVLRDLRRLPAVADETRFGKAEFWEAADAAGGDCEDFALAARAQLMAAGWARGALRLATTWTEKGEFHVVLTVDVRRRNDAVTTLVIDRRYRNVVNWRDMVRAGYRFVSRQAAVGATWVDLASPAKPHAPVLAVPPVMAPVAEPTTAPLVPGIIVASVSNVPGIDAGAAPPTTMVNSLAVITCPDWLALCRTGHLPTVSSVNPAPANLLLTALRQHGGGDTYRSGPWTFQTTAISSAPKVS